MHGVLYSALSRLIGHRLTVRLHLDCFGHSSVACVTRSSVCAVLNPVVASVSFRARGCQEVAVGLNRSRGKRHSDPAAVGCRWVVEI